MGETSCDKPLELVSIIISCGFIVGMIASYLLQHFKIISRRSIEGLSAMYLFLGGLSGFSTLYNAFLLQFGLFRCCAQVVGVIFYLVLSKHTRHHHQSLGVCLGKLMAFLMIFTDFACFTIICILFIFYFPSELKFIELDLSQGGAGHRRLRSHQWTKALIMSYLTTFYAIITGAVAVGLLLTYGDGGKSDTTQIYADSLGLLSTALSFIQFLPQINSTFRARTVGALSMPMIMIQSPVSFLMAYLIAVSEGTNVSTWLPYVASGGLQFILLCIAATWHLRERRQTSLESNDSRDERFVDEKRPLMPREETVDV